MEFLLSSILETKQNHIIDQVPELIEQGASHPIFQQLSRISLHNSCKNFSSVQLNSGVSVDKKYLSLELDHVVNLRNLHLDEKKFATNICLHNIRQGKVAAVILSGGQGTRLGFPGPKGMYDKLGLPSMKTIFQLHIEKITKIRQLFSIHGEELPNIPVYIMTSDLNHDVIVNFFAENNNFGYPTKDVVFFEQGLEPCFFNDGRIIIETPTKVAMAPDGNGGIYNALHRSGSIGDMQKRGVEYLHIYGIDNVLTKSLDPVFLGLCIERQVACGNKVVWRANASEKVGVTVQSEGNMYIIEYSEIPTDMRDAADEKGRLIFGAANICNHFLTVQFIVDSILPNLSSNYHSASKKIPYMDPTTKETVTPTQNNGVKLEMFIFDVFPLAQRNWLVIEGDREDEFAPVKNEPGNPQDSPDTALKAISDQGKRWLASAGAIIATGEESDRSVCEISPLVSYGGEGLESFYGKNISFPVYISDLNLNK